MIQTNSQEALLVFIAPPLSCVQFERTPFFTVATFCTIFGCSLSIERGLVLIHINAVSGYAASDRYSLVVKDCRRAGEYWSVRSGDALQRRPRLQAR
jgi:hypothetical protein